MVIIGKLTILLAVAAIAGCVREEAPGCVNAAPGFLITNVQLVDGTG